MNRRLAQLRKALGMNQKDFASSLSLGQSTLAMIETGKRELTERNIKLICSLYRVSYQWLVNGSGEMFKEDNSDALAIVDEVMNGCEDMNERLKLLRKALRLGSQKDFANKLGVSMSNIASYESGRRNPSDSFIRLLCSNYNVREEWLREGTGDMFESINLDFGKICSEIGTSDPKAKAAIMKYYELSPEDKELFWKFTERFMK